MTAQRGPYSKTPEVRARIIEAASGIFAASGYRGTTMKDVAAACGLTAKGVSHHFSSKDELLMAVLADRDIQAGRAAEGASDGAPDILFDALAESLRKPRLVELYSVLSAEAIAPDHPAHAYYEERYARIRAELSLYLETIASKPLGDTELSAVDFATLLVGVIDGLQIQWLYDEQSVDLERLVRAFVRRLIASGSHEPTRS
ncbi:transcriptional regulator, TetR family [Agreia bicolorata]|uniref:Transcriptional regulator, TetR family n=1 Tax=Agreia bicolorata TaxID=110935 RepID=A0A1T4WTK7_9MICO|nr:TetR/AcrR family transcriptional regulator [Agreia bicolorata]KJC64231.1 hypothetical protein TZ00_07025 [Agreia bicolorata]SKA80195.1 transcriptional regulator, TetR family [Agreia bicolorata]